MAPPPCRKEKVVNPPDPVDLIYGSESTVNVSDVGRQISSARRRRRSISYLGFLGTKFRGRGGRGVGASRAFRTLGRKLSKDGEPGAKSDDDAAHVEELAVCDVPDVGNGAIESLAPFLNSTRTLRSLDLTGASFDADAMRRLNPFFAENPSLQILAFRDNNAVGDKGVDIVTSALEAGDGGRLRVLALESCGLGPTSVSSITNFMIKGGGESLRALELSNNRVGDLGARVLAGALGAGHRLIRLGLNSAGIGDSGASAFASVLKQNRSLSTLTLQKNPGITDAGATNLLDVIYDNKSIKTIVGSNHTLRDVNLRGCNNISDSRLIQTSIKLSARCRLLDTVHEVVRVKITSHIENTANSGVLAAAPQLEDFDLEVMPHLLRFVGESCKSSGMTCLFLTLKSMPVLYTHRDASGTKAPGAHQAESAREEEKEEEEMEVAEEEKQPPRGAGKYYALFKSLAPKLKFIVRPACLSRNGSEKAGGVRHHDVSPEDTFQGICLRYNVTPTELRRANRMSGSNLKLAPDRLVIPSGSGTGQRANPAVSKECKIASLMANVATITRRRLSCMEACAYLEVADWDVDCAIEDVREDIEFFP